MAASKANTAYGAAFFMGTTASPPVYTQMAEIASIKAPMFSIPAIDVTHLQSPNATEELTPGLIKPGSISITGNFIGDATQLNIQTVARTQAVFYFKFTAPVNKGTQVYTVLGAGFITKYEPGPFEPSKKIDFTADIQVTGSINESVV